MNLPKPAVDDIHTEQTRPLVDNGGSAKGAVFFAPKPWQPLPDLPLQLETLAYSQATMLRGSAK